TSNFMAVGFSKTATPASFSASDWCQFFVNFGALLPDYPKLGDTKSFFTVGVNAFAGNTFTGSDIFAVSKPPAGTTCPDAASLKFGITTNLQTATGAAAFTPVPAQQTDTNNTGVAVARPAN